MKYVLKSVTFAHRLSTRILGTDWYSTPILTLTLAHRVVTLAKGRYILIEFAFKSVTFSYEFGT